LAFTDWANWLMAATVEDPGAVPLWEMADAPAVAVAAGLAPITLGAAAPAGAEPVLPMAVVRFWLMSINCSRLFTCTNWLMYSLGSVCAVGSWFCISVTNKVRKSFAEMVAELPLELSVLLVPFVGSVPAVEAAMGFAPFVVNACPAVIG
jgi:hypothetical protein